MDPLVDALQDEREIEFLVIMFIWSFKYCKRFTPV